ncbi:MAG: PepSY domain-containing protein [Peptococcaceae bacterium]|nr:PepSY domain-containing protein [Candidatus Syntrophopropionicum ammoniitolerans]
MKKKKLGILWAGVFLIALVVFVFSSRPANSITLDVNPGIEITTNRLNNVLSVSPLDKEATKVLEGFSVGDQDFDGVVNELVDLMILTGHISTEKNNLILITANDNNAHPTLLEQAGQLIEENLQNRQVGARLLGQTIAYSKEIRTIATDKGISPGKLAVIKKLTAVDSSLSVEGLAPLSLQEILALAEELDIKPEELFVQVKNVAADLGGGTGKEEAETTGTVGMGPLLGMEKALEIALARTDGGQVVEFELEKERGRYEYEVEVKKDDKKYEVEIDAHTGEVLEFKERRDGYQGKNVQPGLLLGIEKALEIALARTDGGQVVEFELVEERGRYEYEVEIKKEGQKYEVEIDAYTGKVLGFKVRELSRGVGIDSTTGSGL